MATKAAELYDEDFYAWTQQQAQALRTHFKGDNRLDVEHLAEEVEDLGKSELHAVESFIEHIIAHLLKLDYSGQVEAAGALAGGDPEPSARASIARSPHRSASMVERELDELYARARGRPRRSGRSAHEPDSDPPSAEGLPLRLGHDLAPRRSRRGRD